MKTETGNSLLTILVLAIGIASVQFAPAQTFKKVNVAGNTPLVQVASGGASVWALASNGNPYIFTGRFVLANTISLSQIAVGGGSTAQADTVWALNSSGSIFHATKSGASWVFTQVPGVLDFIAVGPGYQDNCHAYEVWGLNSSSQIYRYNFCTNSFVQVPGFLCEVSVGGGEIWGADCGPDVFRFDFATGVFDPISSPFAAIPALAVGANGLWAIDTGSQEVYQWDAFLGFQQVISCCSQQIAAGGNGVWLLSGNQILRLNPLTTFFSQVPGVLTSISVGTGGGVWGINSAHQVFKFTTP